MHKLSSALAAIGLSLSVGAQTCSGFSTPTVFSNRQNFAATFWYNLGAYLFDLDVQVPIAISGTRTWLFDEGTGNPTVPNQVGNTAIVDIYTCPTTSLGRELADPASPGSPWLLLGSGTMVVADTRVGDGESRAIFSPPLSLPAGSYGIAMVFHAPLAGNNPGPLHCLGKNPHPTAPYTDQFLTMSADIIQDTAWRTHGLDSPNLRIEYTPAADAAHYAPFGAGCYDRPQAFYERFPPAVGTPDLANTGLSMTFAGDHYQVTSSAATIVPPASPSLTAGPAGSTSSGSWDDALSLPIQLPFSFAYPGGSTSYVTIASNGSVLLDYVYDCGNGLCNALYGDLSSFRDGPARVAAFHHDLDPAAGGGVYCDVDPANQFVRITWEHVPEWGQAIGANTMQVTLHANGDMELAYGTLGNRGANNDAICGFTPGQHARLPAAQDLSATLPFQSGDGTLPPGLRMDARPVLGTTPHFQTTDRAPGVTFQVFVAALDGAVAPGLPLAAFGMPGCSLHLNQPSIFATSLDSTFSVPFAIPASAAFQNVQLFCQVAPLTPGANAAGALVSNGLCVQLGR